MLYWQSSVKWLEVSKAESYCSLTDGHATGPVAAWLGLAWPGLAWLGLAWPGLAWLFLSFPQPSSEKHISALLGWGCDCFVLFFTEENLKGFGV